MRILLFCVVGLFCTVLPGHAQNNTSPYSIIGIGDLEKSTFDRSSGMGHAGMALSSNRFLYQANPASYSVLEDHYFYFEVATRFKAVTYSGTPITDITNNTSTDIQFKKLAFAVKLKPRWALSFGLMPFSTVNYAFNGLKSIQGSNLYENANYLGIGGTNLFYVTNSFIINKHLSVGLQSAYLFGNMDETETLSGQLTDSTVSTERNIYIGNPYFKLGMQYRTKLNSKWDIAFGATASPKTKLRANYSLLAKSGNSILLSTDSYKSNYFTLPDTYTAGVAATLKDAYTFAVDYNYQGWKQLNYSGISYTLENSQRLSVGSEYSKKGSYLNSSYEKYFLQAGFFYENSYIRMSGVQLQDYGLTFGAGTELSRMILSGLGIHAAIEVGQRGTTNNGLIKEGYTQFNVTLSYRDLWISKKMKRYD